MALELVRKFRNLAEVEENRVFIVKDHACLPLVINHLHNSDTEVVVTALECINFLSMSSDNRSAMKKEPNLVQIVTSLKTHKSQNISKLATSILDNLQLVKSIRSSPRTPLSDRSNASTPSTGGSNKKVPHAVTIYFSDLHNEESRKVLSQALLDIKGVISFLIDMYSQKAVIRTLLPASSLLQSVVDLTGMKASLKQFASKENIPDYLPDSDEEDDAFDNSRSITKTKLPPNEDEKQNTWGWGIGRIAKALWG